MNMGALNPLFVYVHLCASVVPLLFLTGCGRPDRANIQLRQQIQELEAQIADLQRQREAGRATIRALEAQRPTVPTLAHERLEALFTTHGLNIGRLTGGADVDPTQPGDEVLKVYVVPTDQRGDLLKAAGSFVVDAFDLSRPDEPQLGHWEISAEEAAKNWYGQALSYGYVLTLPWQRPPQSDQITVRVTFHDALTGREFSAQQVVPVKPPASPATQPTTSP